KTAKFTPLSVKVAPKGDGELGQILIAVIAPYKPRLKPTAVKSRPPQSSDDRRAAAHDIPEQSGPLVLDHQHDRSLIDAEVIRRDPPTGPAIRHDKRSIERRLEPIVPGHPQVHSGKVQPFSLARARGSVHRRRCTGFIPMSAARRSTPSQFMRFLRAPLQRSLC